MCERLFCPIGVLGYSGSGNGLLQLHSGLRRGLQRDLGVLEACGGTCWQFSGCIVVPQHAQGPGVSCAAYPIWASGYAAVLCNSQKALGRMRARLMVRIDRAFEDPVGLPLHVSFMPCKQGCEPVTPLLLRVSHAAGPEQMCQLEANRCPVETHPNLTAYKTDGVHCSTVASWEYLAPK
jgi:hypothetical protein